MSINVNSNIISNTGFNTSGDILNSPSVVTDGLVLWLDAGNIASYNNVTNYYDCGYGCQYYASDPGCTNCNTQWKDMSGYGNDGTLGGNTVINYSNIGGSMYFDGVNDYVNIGINKSCNQLTADFTFSFWVYRESGGAAWGNMMGDYYTNAIATTNEWQIMMNVNGSFTLYKVGPGSIISGAASGFGLNTWMHITFSRIGSTITMYSNGAYVTTGSDSGTFGTSTGNLNIGVDGDNVSEDFNGKIAVVMIYKGKGLSTTEVLQNFNAGRQRFGI